MRRLSRNVRFPGSLWRRPLSRESERGVLSLHEILWTSSAADRSFLRANTARVEVPSLRDMSLNLLDRTSEMNRYVCTSASRSFTRFDSSVSTCCSFTEDDIERSPLNGFPPFWAFLWPGGYGLTRLIQQNSTAISSYNTTVVDIGCGCGSASVAAVAAGARVVLANDIDPLAILATAMNCAESGDGASSRVYGTTANCLAASTAEFLDMVSQYEAATPLQASPPDTCQRVLLVGDMLYDGYIGPSVLKLINGVLDQNWAVYIGDPGRDFANKHLQHMRTDILGEYELPAHIKMKNNGLSSVCVRRVYK